MGAVGTVFSEMREGVDIYKEISRQFSRKSTIKKKGQLHYGYNTVYYKPIPPWRPLTTIYKRLSGVGGMLIVR
tara:strand:+ start:7323 stop:7541 length:219 start_codon:yes stop_codon:yes gene_type:complete